MEQRSDRQTEARRTPGPLEVLWAMWSAGCALGCLGVTLLAILLIVVAMMKGIY